MSLLDQESVVYGEGEGVYTDGVASEHVETLDSVSKELAVCAKSSSADAISYVLGWAMNIGSMGGLRRHFAAATVLCSDAYSDAKSIASYVLPSIALMKAG